MMLIRVTVALNGTEGFNEKALFNFTASHLSRCFSSIMFMAQLNELAQLSGFVDPAEEV